MSVRRAYSHDGSVGAYSDDFISDDERSRSRRSPSPYHNGGHNRDRIRARGGGITRVRGRGKGRRGGRGNSRASEPISMKHDTVTKRVLSASRNRINEFRNQVEEMKIIIRDLEAENKLFKKLQFRQDKAIKSFEDRENDLPRILDKHNNEVRSLKEQNRKLREKFDKSDHYLRDAEDELERVKKRMNKYKDMCEKKELLERDELSRKLTKAEIDMEEKDVKIKELERHMEILKKNHRHELGIEMARQKDYKRQIEELTNKHDNVETQLKEKAKQLEYKNIYTQSINMASTQDISTIGHSPGRKLKKQTSLTELTPRDKAKFYEEKRRDEVRKQKEIKAMQERKKKEKWGKEEKQKEKERPKSESPLHAPEFNFTTIDKGLQEIERDQKMRNSYKEEQEEYRRQSEKEQHDLLERRKELERRQEQDILKQEEQREQRLREDREQEERERMDRENRERRDREERERKEREENMRKEKLERERRGREKEEQERRVQLEKAKLDNDPALREERRKKDELLRKLQDMDKIGNNPSPKKEPEPFSFGSKESTGGYDTPGSKKSDPKEYSFPKPVNNLHKGKPSHEDVTVPYIQRQRHRLSKDDDDVGGYQPSFGGGRGGGGFSSKTTTKPLSLFDDESSSTLKFDTSSKKTEKSTNLLENLFGPTVATNNTSQNLSKGQENETFFITSKSPTSKQTNNTSTTFPWDNVSSPTKNNASRSNFDSNRGGSSTIFGGGAAILDDDISPRHNRALPRRSRQQNVSTFSAKPSVTAVDTFDDEIEEVVL